MPERYGARIATSHLPRKTTCSNDKLLGLILEPIGKFVAHFRFSNVPVDLVLQVEEFVEPLVQPRPRCF